MADSKYILSAYCHYAWLFRVRRIWTREIRIGEAQRDRAMPNGWAIGVVDSLPWKVIRHAS
jgi:hypothetical protein